MRRRIVLIVLLGGIVPLGLWGWWTLSTTRADGEAVLRAQLVASLDEIARGVGVRWIEVRSGLVDLAESPRIRDPLRSGAAPAERVETEVWTRLARVLDGRVAEVLVRDRAGVGRARLRRPSGVQRESSLLPGIRTPVWSDAGTPLGTIEVRMESDALLPRGLDPRWVAGSVFAILPSGEGRPELPVPMSPELLSRPRFEWGAEPWVAERRHLSDPGLILAMASPLTTVVVPLERAGARGLVGLGLATALGIALALFLSGRLVAPLVSLASAADEVSGGELDVHLDPTGPGEVTRVGRAFNQMTASLRSTLAALARRERLAAVGELAASIAHELRNPLTSVRLDLERTAEGLDPGSREAKLVARALVEVERLDRSVGGTLRLARDGVIERRPVALGTLVRSALDRVRPAFEARGVALAPPSYDGLSAETEVMVDPQAIERVLVNLLDNAAAACGAGTRGGVRAGRDAEALVLEVWDEGRGMAEEERRQATDPLFTTRAGGTGLGLPLSRRIVEAHGGRLELRSRPGEGTSVRVSVPWDPRSRPDRNDSPRRPRNDC